MRSALFRILISKCPFNFIVPIAFPGWTLSLTLFPKKGKKQGFLMEYKILNYKLIKQNMLMEYKCQKGTTKAKLFIELKLFH